MLDSDRLSVEQIFGNLIDNAVKYLDASRPGRIVVTGEAAPGGWIVYRIADNGRGVSDRDHERIFELFRRAGRQDRPGEGLGWHSSGTAFAGSAATFLLSQSSVRARHLS
jgi:signal transduction histidine kinase